MCGKAVPFCERSFIQLEAMPPILARRSLADLMWIADGKAEPYRTSGGKAAITLQVPISLRPLFRVMYHRFKSQN